MGMTVLGLTLRILSDLDVVITSELDVELTAVGFETL
jgi:hypothetical protein